MLLTENSFRLFLQENAKFQKNRMNIFVKYNHQIADFGGASHIMT